MKAPIMLLTVGAAGAGFFGDRIATMLGTVAHHPSVAAMAPAVGITAAGVALAWLEFGRSAADQRGFVARFPGVHKLFENRWYIDAFYNKVFVALAHGIAKLMYGLETKGFDAGSDAIAHGTAETGGAIARSQIGRLQLYVGSAVVVIAGICIYLGLS